MGKYAIFALHGEPIIFVHVMLNALDLSERGHDVKVILEGTAVTMIKELRETHSMLFASLEEKGLLDCVCKSCSYDMDMLTYNTESGVRIAGEMTGHPPIGDFIDQGYQIITM